MESLIYFEEKKGMKGLDHQAFIKMVVNLDPYLLFL